MMVRDCNWQLHLRSACVRACVCARAGACMHVFLDNYISDWLHTQKSTVSGDFGREKVVSNRLVPNSHWLVYCWGPKEVGWAVLKSCKLQYPRPRNHFERAGKRFNGHTDGHVSNLNPDLTPEQGSMASNAAVTMTLALPPQQEQMINKRHLTRHCNHRGELTMLDEGSRCIFFSADLVYLKTEEMSGWGQEETCVNSLSIVIVTFRPRWRNGISVGRCWG